jgi:hypothetical protein
VCVVSVLTCMCVCVCWRARVLDASRVSRAGREIELVLVRQFPGQAAVVVQHPHHPPHASLSQADTSTWATRQQQQHESSMGLQEDSKKRMIDALVHMEEERLGMRQHASGGQTQRLLSLDELLRDVSASHVDTNEEQQHAPPHSGVPTLRSPSTIQAAPAAAAPAAPVDWQHDALATFDDPIYQRS